MEEENCCLLSNQTHMHLIGSFHHKHRTSWVRCNSKGSVVNKHLSKEQQEHMTNGYCTVISFLQGNCSLLASLSFLTLVGFKCLVRLGYLFQLLNEGLYYLVYRYQERIFTAVNQNGFPHRAVL